MDFHGRKKRERNDRKSNSGHRTISYVCKRYIVLLLFLSAISTLIVCVLILFSILKQPLSHCDDQAVCNFTTQTNSEYKIRTTDRQRKRDKNVKKSICSKMWNCFFVFFFFCILTKRRNPLIFDVAYGPSILLNLNTKITAIWAFWWWYQDGAHPHIFSHQTEALFTMERTSNTQSKWKRKTAKNTRTSFRHPFSFGPIIKLIR